MTFKETFPSAPAPAKVEVDTLPKEVLDWVNDLRKQYHMPLLDQLPQGMMGRASDCVIARALPRGHAGHANVSFVAKRRFTGSSYYRRVGTPDFVSNFIMKFDSGDYPELVTDRGRRF